MEQKCFIKKGRLSHYAALEILRELGRVNGDESLFESDYHNMLLDAVMNFSIVRNRIENYMPYKMYGIYGKHEIAFIYCDECLSLDIYIKEMKQRIREALKTLKLDRLPLEGATTPFLSAWLEFQLKDANKQVVLSYAQKTYPDLTMAMLQLYVYIRKNTDYQMTLHMSNQEIFDLFKKVRPETYKKDFRKVTWNSLNHLKRIFGYAEERNEQYEKEKAFKESHRKEILFWRKTGACMVSDESYNAYCSFYAAELGLTDEEYQKLYDWCLQCKYKGIYKTKDADIYRIRKEIITRYGINNPVNKVLCSGVSGYASLVDEKLSQKLVLSVVL